MLKLNWIIRRNDTIIEYVQGTYKDVKKYLEELYDNDSNSEYCAMGCGSAFADTIKYRILG